MFRQLGEAREEDNLQRRLLTDYMTSDNDCKSFHSWIIKWKGEADIQTPP